MTVPTFIRRVFNSDEFLTTDEKRQLTRDIGGYLQKDALLRDIIAGVEELVTHKMQGLQRAFGAVRRAVQTKNNFDASCSRKQNEFDDLEKELQRTNEYEQPAYARELRKRLGQLEDEMAKLEVHSQSLFRNYLTKRQEAQHQIYLAFHLVFENLYHIFECAMEAGLCVNTQHRLDFVTFVNGFITD